MRLVVTAGPQRVWVVLEPETADEATASEACAAREEWTNGRGADAIVRLRRWRRGSAFRSPSYDTTDLA
jgi:hypothetical protein